MWDGWTGSRQNHLGRLEIKFISGFFLVCEHSDGSLVCIHEPESRPSGLFQCWAGMTQFTCQRISQYWWTSTASGPKKEEKARTFLWFYLWLYIQNKHRKKCFILYLGLEYKILKLIIFYKTWGVTEEDQLITFAPRQVNRVWKGMVHELNPALYSMFYLPMHTDSRGQMKGEV